MEITKKNGATYEYSQVSREYIVDLYSKIKECTKLKIDDLINNQETHYLNYDSFFENKWILQPKSTFKTSKIIKLLDYKEYDFVLYKNKDNYTKVGFYIIQIDDRHVVETQKGKIISTKSIIKKIN